MIVVTAMDEQLKRILSSRPKKRLATGKLKAAAVLVPLFHDGREYRVLLTKRSRKVFHHKGQISFPGGKPYKTDASLLDTALRESWEEIGLQARDVEIIGELDDTPTVTSGFNITPFVALIPYPYSFTRNPQEIDEILDLPLAAFLDTSRCKQHTENNDGKPTTGYRYECDNRIIWGATARILKQIADTLKAAGNLGY